MSNQTDLDWLALNVHVWPVEATPKVSIGWRGHKDGEPSYVRVDLGEEITKAEWLARRAELQNKPSWKDAPEWASYLCQDSSGFWWFFRFEPEVSGSVWDSDNSAFHHSSWVAGEVLGDWRDTLQKRPAELSEQAVIARLKEATDNVLVAVPGLKSDRYKFDPFTSIEDNQEQDMQQDNGWFERGELPPVGAVCLYVVSDRISAEVEITAHAKFGICFVRVGQSGESYVSKTAELHRFRPIRTERDVLMSVLEHYSGALPKEHQRSEVVHAILAAGFKLDSK